MNIQIIEREIKAPTWLELSLNHRTFLAVSLHKELFIRAVTLSDCLCPRTISSRYLFYGSGSSYSACVISSLYSMGLCVCFIVCFDYIFSVMTHSDIRSNCRSLYQFHYKGDSHILTAT